MGTYYRLIYQDHANRITKARIDSILIAINLSASTYIDSSTISKINRSSTYGKEIEVLANGRPDTRHQVNLANDIHFIKNYELSERIFLETQGAFDPTIMPLVNYWGFGYTPKKAVAADQNKIDSILAYIGMDKVSLEVNTSNMTIVKPARLQLDFSGVAKGYAVDQLTSYLKNAGISNMMIDIGGEVYATGSNPLAKKWTVGLNMPKEDAALTDIISLINLDNQGLASSGNYRNFHVINGKKYGHEINPKSGHPELNDLLAVSVIAPSCAEADAIATGLMIMGLSKAESYVEDYPNIEASFFYSDSSGIIQSRYSEGMSKMLVKNL